ERGQKGAADRADAADDDDDERENEDVITHSGLDREDGGDHDAGKAREHGAEAEHDHEQAPDIDAERGYHRRVGGAGTHQHANAGGDRQAGKAARSGRPRGGEGGPATPDRRAPRRAAPSPTTARASAGSAAPRPRRASPRDRSEERRVGKEGRCRWAPAH